MKPGEPSRTAVGVATSVVASRQDQALRRLCRDPEEPFTTWFINEHSEKARRLLEAATSSDKAQIMNFLREQVGRGANLFTIVRKTFIEDEVRAALDAGAVQLVVLGAGYDALALRLARERPHVRCYEIDHPPTQDVKRRALVARDALPPNFVLLPVDFSQESGEERLWSAPGFDRRARGCFLCEGTLMYLDGADAASVFGLVNGSGGPGSRFVFTWLDPVVLETDERSKTIASVLESQGEPLLSTFDPARLPAFLKRRGFRLAQVVTHELLRERYLDPLEIKRDLSPLEYIAIADRT